MIQVTKPFLPPKKAYIERVSDIFERNWLTNDGPLVRQLETSVPEFLGTPNMAFVSNGTIALQLAIRALKLSGEIITTPFSYVATSTSILWEGCTPVFVDIDSNGFNIDVESIESAITEETSAILVTHCFGIPCDVERIQEIAARKNLKVLYDAAHCFGTTHKGASIFNFGDISTCSFHATKLFHTIEGGGIFASEQITREIKLMRNFGHDGPEQFSGIGINGKNSEFHAAMGISILPHMDEILSKRRTINASYFELLNHLDSVRLVDPNLKGWNCAYCPAVFTSEELCLSVKERLEQHNIHPRRYFYPSLESIHGRPDDFCPRSVSVASRILCLPSFHDLTFDEITLISKLIAQVCTS